MINCKKILSILLFYIIISCSTKDKVDKYEIQYLCKSNFAIIHWGLYKYEKLQIIINNKYVYEEEELDSLSLIINRYYKLPENVTRVDVKSWYNNKLVLNKIILDSTQFPKKLIISTPIPKSMEYVPFGTKLGFIPIQKSKRDIRIKKIDCDNYIVY